MEVTCWSWKKKVERPDASFSPFDLLLLLLNAFKLLTSRDLMFCRFIKLQDSVAMYDITA